MMDKDKTGLDAFFDAARQDAPMPSGDFMARMTAQALAEQPLPRVKPVPWWQQVLQALGGWRGATGLAAACAAGVWIGISPPVLLESWMTSGTSDLSADATGLGALGVDPLSGFDLALWEG